MLDQYLQGEVERISPEAPVPVVLVRSERLLLGAAGNVARNVQSLGGDPVLVGVRGGDPDGEALEALLADAGLACDLCVDTARPTTKKTRVMAGRQQVVRVDTEQSGPVRRQVLDQVFERLARQLPGAGVVVVSDYGKGLVTRPFMARLRRLLAGMDRPPLVLVDPKTRNFALYKDVDLITPNTKEAAEGAGVRIESRADILRAGQAIFRKLRVRNLLVTLGPQGMALFEGPKRVVRIPTAAQKVYDVTGAGDTVIAALGLGLAAGLGLLEACTLANYAAGIVVGEVGTAAATPDELRRRLEEGPDMEYDVWMDGEAR